jgi:hypothetical protein
VRLPGLHHFTPSSRFSFATSSKYSVLPKPTFRM